MGPAKKAIAVVLVIVAIMGVVQNSDRSQEIARAVAARNATKAALAAQLNDPASVQWRQVFVAARGDTLYTCGEFNAKNATGGYQGFRKFVGSGERVVVMGREDYDTFSALWERCGTPSTMALEPEDG